MKLTKSYVLCETAGTVSWLIMDYSWMSGYRIMSEIFGLIAIFLLIAAFWLFKGKKLSDRLSYVASFLWCIMNFLWMKSEYLQSELLLGFAKFIFIDASIFVILIVISSKIEKSLPDIKRLKIK